MKLMLYTRPEWRHWMVIETRKFANMTLILWPKGNLWIGPHYDGILEPTKITIVGTKVPKRSYNHDIRKVKISKCYQKELLHESNGKHHSKSNSTRRIFTYKNS